LSELLVIFDVHGTLVDSEFLCYQALNALIPEIRETTYELVHLYRGRKLLEIFADVKPRKNIELRDDFKPKYRERVAELFSLNLKPFLDVMEMLTRIPYKFCIASNGPKHKIRRALSVTGLSHYFEENIYSAFCFGSWKPDTGVFLHAPAGTGYRPENCVVIEDSVVGIQAATAANMHAFRFVLEVALPEQSNTFTKMDELLLL
jgi:HAD superfamily hydrolase (TIGR01509 family)